MLRDEYMHNLFHNAYILSLTINISSYDGVDRNLF